MGTLVQAHNRHSLALGMFAAHNYLSHTHVATVCHMLFHRRSQQVRLRSTSERSIYPRRFRQALDGT